MEVIHERCCGLDVHKDTVMACALVPGRKLQRTFGTTTRELMGLADWLGELGVTTVAMESTGVYWKCVYNLLESFELTLVLVNARCDLHLRVGLFAASHWTTFWPGRPFC